MTSEGGAGFSSSIGIRSENNPPRFHLCKNCGAELSGGNFCSKKCQNQFYNKKHEKTSFDRMIRENTVVYELDEVLDLYREIRYGYLPNGEVGVVWEGEWIPDGDDE